MIGKDIKNSQMTFSQSNIDKIFSFFELLIKETFGTIHSLIKNGMIWGILFIIFFQFTTTKAAMINSNSALGLGHTTGLNFHTTPEILSPLSTGGETIIYGSTTAFTKTYIMNLGTVEDKLIVLLYFV